MTEKDNWTRRLVSTASVVLFLSACGGGESQQAITGLSTGSLAFSVASPDAPAPGPQTFTAALSAGTVYVAIVHQGAAIASTAYALSGGTAQIVVTPASPGNLGVGAFTATVAVTGYSCADTACSALVSGNTGTVSVTYSIPPIVRYVAPYVGIVSTAGNAIIRGQGFKKVDVQGVTFGGTAATTFSVVDDTQIQAEYPALAAGTHSVQIQATNSPGVITSSANLAIAAAPAVTATTLAYPSASPQVKGLAYDAERQALLVAVDSAGGTVLRYPFAGGVWGAPVSVALAGLADLALSTNGQQLLALSQTGLTPLDPATLTTGSTTAAPVLPTGAFLKNLAVVNDGKAVVTTGIADNTDTSLYVYDTRSPGFSQPATTPSLNNATPGVSADGSLASIAQGDPSLTTSPAVYQYFTRLGAFAAANVSLIQNAVAPVLNRSATRIVLNGTQVYDSGYNLLGTLPATTVAVVVVDKSVTTLYDTVLAFTYDSAASRILSFDLTATASGGSYSATGPGVVLPGDPGAGVKMAVSPDGGSLFLAGSNALAVLPSPP